MVSNLVKKCSLRGIVAGTFILSALPLLIVEMFPGQLKFVLTPASYLIFHNVAEFFSVMVSFSMFGLIWYTYDQSKDRHALFLGTAFLGIGIMDFMHTLSNAALPGFFTPNSSDKSIQFWIAVRMFQGVAFLVSAYIYAEKPTRWVSKGPMLVFTLLVSSLVFIGIIFFPAHVPTMFVEGTGVTPLKKFSEYLIIALLCAAAAAYSRRLARTGDRLCIYYLAALIVCIFSELPLAFYARAFDTYNLLGHINKLVAFFLIYYGIFRASVKEPYIRLAETSEGLNREVTQRKRAEEELTAHKEHLEDLVKARTAELEIRNAQLAAEITERKRTETERDRVAQQRQLALNSAQMGWWHYDPVSKVATWDDRYKEIFEVSGYQLPNDEILARLHPDDLPGVWAKVEAALNPADPQAYSAEYRINLPDGSRRWVEAHGMATFEGKGEARRATSFVGTAADITQRKRMEEELRKSEEKSRLLIKHAPSMIYEIDFHGPAFKSVNEAMCHLLGYTREELLAINPLDLIDDESKPVFQERIRRRLAGEMTGDSLECKGKSKDGREIWALLNINFTEKDGKPEGAVVVAHDITERKRMEEELRKSRNGLEIKVQERTAELAGANEELRGEMARREKAEQQLLQSQKMESIGTLAGGIAHDFNNILGAIVINSELGLLDLERKSELRNNLEMILQSGLRGKDLVKQLLLFSRKSEKKQEIVTLTPLVKETFKLLRASIPTTIEMKLQLETESDGVYADPSQIQQVVMNLCTNAAYAMRGTTGSIDICLQGIAFNTDDLPEPDMQPGGYVILSVKDTGCGMDAEIKKRIFEPFFTTKQVGEGTGLGLSVAYGIVKNHKGNISVYSERGKGSIFKVYLPKADTRAAVDTEVFNPIPRGNERILLVDDEEFIIHSVRNMLQHLGYKVTALMDSREASKLFSADPSQFDLVMTDQTMPFMTGEDLGKEMMRIRPDIPVILCTGYADLITSERAKERGFQGFIMKPFTVREGAELVRRVLDDRTTGDK